MAAVLLNTKDHQIDEKKKNYHDIVCLVPAGCNHHTLLFISDSSKPAVVFVSTVALVTCWENICSVFSFQPCGRDPQENQPAGRSERQQCGRWKVNTVPNLGMFWWNNFSSHDEESQFDSGIYSEPRLNYPARKDIPADMSYSTSVMDRLDNLEKKAKNIPQITNSGDDKRDTPEDLELKHLLFRKLTQFKNKRTLNENS